MQLPNEFYLAINDDSNKTQILVPFNDAEIEYRDRLFILTFGVILGLLSKFFAKFLANVFSRFTIKNDEDLTKD